MDEKLVRLLKEGRDSLSLARRELSQRPGEFLFVDGAVADAILTIDKALTIISFKNEFRKN